MMQETYDGPKVARIGHLGGQRGRSMLHSISALPAAGAVIILAAGYLVSLLPGSPPAAAAATSEVAHVGSANCAGCHAKEFESWTHSQHAQAMAKANPRTVLGDFSSASAESHGSTAQFSERGGRYFVTTDGKDGKPADFEIKDTFGIEPLQQYLAELPGGRLQALPFAWDARAKGEGGQRWFHLYPDRKITHADELHWTGLQQNWNFMCAECHSTAVRKGYDLSADSYDTSYSEITVGCEACHGAGAGHVAWAKGDKAPDVPNRGFAAAAPRRSTPNWSIDLATGSPRAGVTRPPGNEVETCARCHSRRGIVSEDWQPGRPLADTHLPAFLTPDLFEDDGQMREEVFSYSSFQQSKMYARGVACSDCHDPHSGKLVAARSDTCTKCHQPDKFASTAHTGHQATAGAPDCVSCHMPARTYMVLDRRHDHSFRIPRPDLSVDLGTPNTCNACHTNKDAAWAAAAIERWHGTPRKGFQTFARAFHSARTRRPEARELLLGVVRDANSPALARATALLSLGSRPSAGTDVEMTKGLSDPDPMVRIAALRGLAPLPVAERWNRAKALMVDPVRSVRIEAASIVADQPDSSMQAQDRASFAAAAEAYIAAQRLNADRPEHRSNIAGFLARRGRTAEAEHEYLAAIKLAPRMTELYVNLADYYRTQEREQDAERLLREAVAITPDQPIVRHALGLCLIRQKKYETALDELKRASELAPGNSRFAYVYAVALESAGWRPEARQVASRAYSGDPSDVDLLSFLLQDALSVGNARAALDYAESLTVLAPDDTSLPSLIDALKSKVGRQ